MQPMLKPVNEMPRLISNLQTLDLFLKLNMLLQISITKTLHKLEITIFKPPT